MTRIALAALMLAAAAPALAQTVSTAPPKVAAPAEPPVGPPLPGVCLLNLQGAIGASKVGQMASKRLQQFADEIKSQYGAEKAPLDAQAQALQAQVSKIGQAEFQQRAQPIAVAEQKLQLKYEQRARQMDGVRQQVMVKIAESANPLITPIYTAHHCSIIFDRNSVIGGNMSGDLTQELVASMDATLTDINFAMPPWPDASAAPAAAPAAEAKPATSSKKKK